MIIQDIFKKSITRPINGVVQAGQLDEATIQNEMEEYVVTAEIADSLQTFYQNYIKAYKTPTKDVGVWVSGFFGSGKSHFLKILSYLLDGKVIDGQKPYEYFTDKMQNEQLLQNMMVINEKKSDALLFNVGSESGANSARSNKESVIEIMLRIFNNHLGYSKTLWVANFERHLDEEGHFEQFKQKISELYDESWESFRNKVVTRRKKIIIALMELGYDEESASFIFEITKKEFAISAKELGELVAVYCKKQGPDYRLVFLIDEVGQYIGTDNNLMLDLQNAVEEIGAAAMGQAWVVVTSQEKITAVANISSTNDFSKIQGRFATRINLSSSNTDVVIKRRLLEKTETAEKTLQATFEPSEQLIKNRLAFDSNTTQLRSGYRSVEEFTAFYPFIPYQIDLLQRVLEKINIHGEGGTSTSRGERSLLKAFQEAAILNGQEKIGNLVTMAEFFPSIRHFLESTITQTISSAENRAKNHEGLLAQDIDVLKVLYLIKGIDHVKATPNNVATLLLEAIDSDQTDLPIKESLNRLEQAMFIEKHADGTYSFLSDEEQEINKEIRNVEVNVSKIKEQIGDLFFTKMYPKAKFDYRKDTPPFDFNKRFDSYSKGNMSHALTLQVYSGSISRTEAQLQAVEGQMVIYLSEELIAEAEEAIRYSEQVRRYVNLKRNNSTTTAQHRIYDAKLMSTEEFEQKAEELVKKACEQATFYIQMQERIFRGNFDVQMTQAFTMLIQNTYKYLEYIDTPIAFKAAKDEWKHLVEKGIDNDLLDETGNRKAFEEVLRYLEEVIRLHQKPSLKEVVEKYGSVPYGWSEYDTIGLVLALLHAGKLHLTVADERLLPTTVNFYDKLGKLAERDKIRIIPEIEVDPKIRREFTGIFREFFGRLEVGDSYQEFATAITDALTERFIQPLTSIKQKREANRHSNYPYPGEREINALSMDIHQLLQIRNPEQLVREFTNIEDDLEEWTDTIDQLVGFYLKSPIERFDEAVQSLSQNQADLQYMQSETVNIVKKQMTDILTKAEPYRDIPQLPVLSEKLQQAIQTEVTEQKQAILVQIEQFEERVIGLRDFYHSLVPVLEVIQQFDAQFKLLKEQIIQGESIVAVRIKLDQLRSLTDRIEQLAKKKEQDILNKPAVPTMIEPDPDIDTPLSPPQVIHEKQTKYISPIQLASMITHKRITTQQDLDDAIQELRLALLKELKNNTLEIN
ncbi:BREX system P-loop protein BrxC [Exiguobacterium sp. SH0S1]|uniref:BREX system P-loop protein BrxC n=1 Tax=Exiguobacterium sp. SH0S1 TaxID=2510949 RepID=UPI00103D0BE4|nr:BREX system P-loop protein BrxC [Exiguobacterium sp. SH0S1]TCI75719.1 BREX system P-loop protein BrxC [Exiguobacterium sp. SH0S1]